MVPAPRLPKLKVFMLTQGRPFTEEELQNPGAYILVFRENSAWKAHREDLRFLPGATAEFTAGSLWRARISGPDLIPFEVQVSIGDKYFVHGSIGCVAQYGEPNPEIGSLKPAFSEWWEKAQKLLGEDNDATSITWAHNMIALNAIKQYAEGILAQLDELEQ